MWSAKSQEASRGAVAVRLHVRSDASTQPRQTTITHCARPLAPKLHTSIPHIGPPQLIHFVDDDRDLYGPISPLTTSWTILLDPLSLPSRRSARDRDNGRLSIPAPGAAGGWRSDVADDATRRHPEAAVSFRGREAEIPPDHDELLEHDTAARSRNT
jgi:hypothetical protein